MKKFLSFALVLTLILSCFTFQTSFAEDDIKVTINGQNLTMDQPPVLISDRTLVPVRAIFEALGAKVDWNNDTNTATGVLGETTVEIQIENTVAKVNGKDVILDVPAKLISDRTLVPVRFISESLGAKVDWDNDTQTVIITTKENGTLKKWIFDDLTSFENNKDFIIGGNYKSENITLSTEKDHTTGNGKSVKIANRTAVSQRLKLKDAFSVRDLGKKLVVSAWVYVPDVSTSISLSLYGDKETQYAYEPAAYVNVDVPKNEWTKIELEYEHKIDIITQIGIDQRKMGVEVAPTIYVDDVEVYDPSMQSTSSQNIKKYDFDSLTSFENNKDFIPGGNYKSSNITLSKEQDHTSGNGQSVKVANRTETSQRVKFMNMFSPSDVNKLFIVSAWVYVPDVSTSISLSLYGDKGTQYAFDPAAYVNVDVPKNEWTKIELEYKHTIDIITQIGIDQRKMGVEAAPTIYVDDIEIEEIVSPSTNTDTSTQIGSDGKGTVLGIPVKTSSDGLIRPDLSGANGYDDLIFYTREFENLEEQKGTPDEIFKGLTGGRIVVNTDKLMQYSVSGEKFGTVEKVKVDGKDVIRAIVETLPENAYAYQLTIPEMTEGTDFADGDTMLLVFNMRTIKADNEMSTGKVQCIVEQNASPYAKALSEYVEAETGENWTKVYLPFTAKAGFPRLCIRLGYYKQTIEIGDYELYNFGTKYALSDMPSNKTSVTYDGRELFDKDVSWRKEAWDRIEKIRKGDIKVVVKDSSGNVIPNANVSVNMADHQFKFGSAVNTKIVNEGDFGKSYADAVKILFNAAVLENNHKWNIYEQNKEQTDQMMDKLKELGVKYIRGHALIWDRNVYDPKTGEYTDNTTVPEELAKLIYTDEAAMNEMIKNHIYDIVKRYDGKIVEWDVVNELVNNKAIRSKYGNKVLNDWFKWAREAAGDDVDLYINETGFHGTNNDQYNTFCSVLDYMTQNNVDFDGIGVQGHFGSVVNPVNFYNQISSLANKYNKKITITEYDAFNSDMKDLELDASFLRDTMIMCFSQESVEGFMMWGFNSAAHWKRFAPIFNEDWTLKPSGEQWLDLVYNKWWTNESGVSDSNGEFKTRGFYGDYDITATANGKTKTVSAKCYKENDNTITITID